jgi:hypothetical protein
MHAVQHRGPERVPAPAAELDDTRFRRLLGAAAWATLPEPVRRRFGKRLGPGLSASFTGTVVACRMRPAGRALAEACRLVGAPLPLEPGAGAAAIVTVTEDARSGGQVWTRIYARRSGFPQVIHSAKRFAGPTGLEEYLGAGVGIALDVQAIPGGIRFSSRHYFLALRGARLRLPAWLAPGRLTIEHVDAGAGCFDFTLALRHRLLGELMHQHCRFADQASTGETDHD